MTVTQTLDQVMHIWAKSNVPIIKPILLRIRLSKRWRIHLQEEWPNENNIGSSSPLDGRVEWVFETLKTWDTAKRTSWDMWEFDNKREAEKFITLYTLQWA